MALGAILSLTLSVTAAALLPSLRAQTLNIPQKQEVADFIERYRVARAEEL